MVDDVGHVRLQRLEVDLEHGCWGVDVELGGDARVHFADEANDCVADDDFGGATGQVREVVRFPERRVDVQDVEQVLQVRLCVGEAGGLAAREAPAVRRAAGDDAAERLDLVREVAVAGW